MPFLLTLLADATEVQPIPPSQIVDATKNVSAGATQAGHALAGSLAHIALVIAGLVLLIGIGLAVAHVTNKLLKFGAGVFFGVFVMYVLLVYPDKVLGLISGFLNAFFGHLKPGAMLLRFYG